MEKTNPKELIHLELSLRDLLKNTGHRGIPRLMDRIGGIHIEKLLFCFDLHNMIFVLKYNV